MFSTRIHPRFSDTDALGHINNTVIPVWFLEAREPVLRLFSPTLDLRQAALAVVRIEVDYLAETRFGADVEVRTRVARLGNSSLQLAQEVWQEGTLTARGLATLVNFDPVQRRASPIPESVRTVLEQHQEAEGEG
jgi:acyl-CoA thioester hydrolase